MRPTHADNGIRKARNLIAPNLKAIEIQDVRATARVTVMLKPSERKSIFDRITFHGSTPERELNNYDGVSKADILQAYRIETRSRLETERRLGYIQAKRENLLPPTGPGVVIPMRRMAA